MSENGEQRALTLVQSQIPSPDELTDICLRLLEDHKPRHLSAAGLGNSCLSCDELFPCDIARLINVVIAGDKSPVRLADQFDAITEKIIEIGDTRVAAAVVWSAWKAAMIRQRRDIKPSQESWNKMTEQDIEIDECIARRLTEHVVSALKAEAIRR